MGLGAAVGIVASASSASALSFNFSFTNTDGSTSGTVTGTITGLADNANNQTGPVVAVTSSPSNQGLGTYTYSSAGNGFNVAGGTITVADWLGNSGGFSLDFNTPLPNVRLLNGGGYQVQDNTIATLSFTPVAAVPFEFSPSLGFAIVGLGLGASQLKSLLRRKNNQ